jgi:hypothetical protein
VFIDIVIIETHKLFDYLTGAINMFEVTTVLTNVI